MDGTFLTSLSADGAVAPPVRVTPTLAGKPVRSALLIN